MSETPILDRLSHRIFTIGQSEDSNAPFELTESCDSYWSECLTADELRQLAHELLSIADGNTTVEKAHDYYYNKA